MYTIEKYRQMWFDKGEERGERADISNRLNKSCLFFIRYVFTYVHISFIFIAFIKNIFFDKQIIKL